MRQAACCRRSVPGVARCASIRSADEDMRDGAIQANLGQGLRMPKIAALIRVRAGAGSPGRAQLGLPASISLRWMMRSSAIATRGRSAATQRRGEACPRRSHPKAAQPRYEAFLDRAPAFIAAEMARRPAWTSACASRSTCYDAARALIDDRTRTVARRTGRRCMKWPGSSLGLRLEPSNRVRLALGGSAMAEPYLHHHRNQLPQRQVRTSVTPMKPSPPTRSRVSIGNCRPRRPLPDRHR